MLSFEQWMGRACYLTKDEIVGSSQQKFTKLCPWQTMPRNFCFTDLFFYKVNDVLKIQVNNLEPNSLTCN